MKIWVTFCSLRKRYSDAMSFRATSGAMHTVPPLDRGPNRNICVPTNEKLEMMPERVSSRIAASSWTQVQSTMCSSILWMCSTPFGFPVVPEVYRSIAVESSFRSAHGLLLSL